MTDERGTQHQTRRKRLLGATLVGAMVVALAACQPVTFGNPGSVVGNDLTPGSCPGNQPVRTAPCGPQPLLWASVNAPFAMYLNGDPYSTRCSVGGGSGTACTQGNPLYRSTGYSFVIDVAKDDVGKPLTLQVYDFGAYPRFVGAEGASKPQSRDIGDLTVTNGSPTVTSATANFVASDVNRRIVYGPANRTTTISSVTNATTAQLAVAANLTGVLAATIGYDCNTSVAPFNTSPTPGVSQCQTGDTGSQNMELQVFANDGSGAPSFTTPLAGCRLAHSSTEFLTLRSTFKNAWVDVCTFVPDRVGVFAVRVRSGGIDGMVDVGDGYDNYALKVLGGTATKLHPVGDHSIWLNPTNAQVIPEYLIDVPKNHAGKKIVVDLFDPGDGSGPTPFTLQLRGPPGGAPATTPTLSGTIVPAPGVATGCTYNAGGSSQPGAATPDVATNCAVVTYDGSGAGGIYNGKWLRIEVTLDAAYSCETDCWWTLVWNFGPGSLPTDRVTYTAKVV